MIIECNLTDNGHLKEEEDEGIKKKMNFCLSSINQ